MSVSSIAKPRIALILALVFLCVIPAAAQSSQDLNNYPTLVALNTAVIPARDRVSLAERLLNLTNVPQKPVTAAVQQVGTQQTFKAANSSDNTTIDVPATLRYVGQHIYMWVENDANVNMNDLQTLAHDFDTNVYPNVRALWGSEATPGVDGDAHIYGLFAHGLGASTAAYFSSDNTYPREVTPSSNEHEMFFFNLDAIGGSNIPTRAVDSIIAHEFQHMIRFNQQVNTETWLNEGLSVFTQYYLYGDTSMISSFLNAPSTQLDDWNPVASQRAANYGAATLFLTYLYERYGIDTLHDLSADHKTRALQAVNDVLTQRGEPGVDAFFGDWVLANVLGDTQYDDGRYSYPDLSTLQTPPAKATVKQYPFQTSDTANQYSADYYDFSSLNGAHSIDVNLTAPTSVLLIPTTAASGTHFWYSNRDDMADSRLTHSFDLTSVQNATLNYKVWYDTETSWDYGYLMVSDNGGKHWDVIPTSNTTTADPHGVTYGAGYNGASNGWVNESVSLNNYAGKQILVRFEMITDDAVTRPGLAIDDVSIPEIGYADDFENDNGGWQAEGWLLTDNQLPQDGWVQVVQRSGTTTLDIQRWAIDNLNHNIPLVSGANQVIVAVSPFAPVTTVAMPYTLSVQKGS